MAVGRGSHSKWLCSCSLSFPGLTSAYSTYTLRAGQTFPHPCLTAQLTIAYQTADEESAPQRLSSISRFRLTVDLGAHEYGFLCAHACALVCVCVVRMRACVGICEHMRVPERLRGCVGTYVLACVGAWLRAWPPACVSGCLSLCVHGRLCAWVPALLHACMFSQVPVFECSLPGILQPSIAISFSRASA